MKGYSYLTTMMKQDYILKKSYHQPIGSLPLTTEIPELKRL